MRCHRLTAVGVESSNFRIDSLLPSFEILVRGFPSSCSSPNFSAPDCRWSSTEFPTQGLDPRVACSLTRRQGVLSPEGKLILIPKDSIQGRCVSIPKADNKFLCQTNGDSPNLRMTDLLMSLQRRFFSSQPKGSIQGSVFLPASGWQ